MNDQVIIKQMTERINGKFFGRDSIVNAQHKDRIVSIVVPHDILIMFFTRTHNIDNAVAYSNKRFLNFSSFNVTVDLELLGKYVDTSTFALDAHLEAATRKKTMIRKFVHDKASTARVTSSNWALLEYIASFESGVGVSCVKDGFSINISRMMYAEEILNYLDTNKVPYKICDHLNDIKGYVTNTIKRHLNTEGLEVDVALRNGDYESEIIFLYPVRVEQSLSDEIRLIANVALEYGSDSIEANCILGGSALRLMRPVRITKDFKMFTNWISTLVSIKPKCVVCTFTIKELGELLTELLTIENA